MARGTWISDAMQKLIQQLISDGKTVMEMPKLLKSSSYKIYNAHEHVKQPPKMSNSKLEPEKLHPGRIL